MGKRGLKTELRAGEGRECTRALTAHLVHLDLFCLKVEILMPDIRCLREYDVR